MKAHKLSSGPPYTQLASKDGRSFKCKAKIYKKAQWLCWLTEEISTTAVLLIPSTNPTYVYLMPNVSSKSLYRKEKD